MAATPNLSVDIQGLLQTTQALQQWGARASAAYAGAIYMLGTNVLSTSMKLAPADTGYLRASRYLRRPEVIAGGAFTMELGYGAPYALFVHEIDQRYVVGEWKFLAKAIDYHAASSGSDLASFMGKLFAAGMGIDDVPETHPRIWTGGERRHNRKRMRDVKPADPSVLGDNKRAKRERTAIRRANKRRREQRANDRAANIARIRAESAESLKAQRAGRALPRPGRGRP